MSTNTLFDPDQEPNDNSARSFGYGLGLSAVVIFVFVVTLYCLNLQTIPTLYSDDEYGEETIQHGLDAPTISTFPQCTYAQLKPYKSAGGRCTVCLGDYRDAEILRLLPGCGHIFHRSCIDPWLLTNPTCPICRGSPHLQPAPVANQ